MKKLSCVLLAAAYGSLMVDAVASPKHFSVKEAAPLVINYLSSTGCPDAETVDSDSFAKFSDAALKVSGYVAVVTADTSCAGGTGTIGSTLVFLRTDNGSAARDMRFVRVSPEMSEPIARAYGAPKVVTGVYQKGGQLYATGLEFAKDDGHCCPSIKTLYKVGLKKRVVTLNRDDVRPAYTWVFTPVN